MRLIFKFFLFIILINILFCTADVWIDKELGLKKFSILCEIFTGKSQTDPISAENNKENYSFNKCNSQLQTEWLTLFPIASCMVEFYSVKSVFIIKANEHTYYYPETYLDDESLCTRFFYKPNMPPLFRPSNLNTEEQAKILKDIIDANSSMRAKEYQEASDKFKGIVTYLASTVEHGVIRRHILHYVYENMAFNNFHHFFSYFDNKIKVPRELIDFIKDVHNKLKFDKESFFKNLLYAYYYGYLIAEDSQTGIKYLKKAAIFNKGDVGLAEEFIVLYGYQDADEYLEKALGNNKNHLGNYAQILREKWVELIQYRVKDLQWEDSKIKINIIEIEKELKSPKEHDQGVDMKELEGKLESANKHERDLSRMRKKLIGKLESVKKHQLGLIVRRNEIKPKFELSESMKKRKFKKQKKL
jgi:hypothetical protein